jgi:cytochrome d ubiquinol oxidase subunit I
VRGGIPIPGMASILSDPSSGTSTVVQGLNSFPEADRPTYSQANTVHLAWDVMVGLGSFLLLIALWYGVSWVFRKDMPNSKWFLRIAACCGVLAVITMEAGWIVSEVGRQPWIVYNYMKVEDAATENTGVWLTFVIVVLIYLALGVTTVLVLRNMSRRFRAADEAEQTDETVGVPYGPHSDELSETGMPDR